MTSLPSLKFIVNCRKLGSQFRALIGGLMVILFSGQHLAWGIFDHRVINHKWYRNLLPQAAVWHYRVVVVWFLSVIFGLQIGSRLVKSLSKCSLYLICLAFALTSSLLFIVQATNVECILLARILAGLASGVAYIAILSHAADTATEQDLLGTVAALIHMITFLGVFLASAINTSPIDSHFSEHLDFNRTFGVISASYITVGFVLVYIFSQTLTPENKLRLDREKLNMTTETVMIEDERTLEQSNFISIFYIIILRIAHVCTFNMPLNVILLLTTSRAVSMEADLTEIILSFWRIFMSLFMMGLIDLWRRQFALISTVVCASLMLFITLLTYFYGIDYIYPTYIVVTGILLQIFASMGVKIHADIMSVEFVRNNKQQNSTIAHTALVENIIQILFIVIYFNDSMRFITFSFLSAAVILGLTFGMICLGYPLKNKKTGAY